MATRLAHQGRTPLQWQGVEDTGEPEERIDKLLVQAKRAQSEAERSALYVRAIDTAVTHKLFDRAQKLRPQISDLILRGELGDYISYYAAKYAGANNDLEEAKRWAAQCRHPERLAHAFIAITQEFDENEQQEQATQILSEAAQRLHRFRTSAKKARAMIRLADAMLAHDVFRAYDLIAMSIPIFNATDAQLESIDGVAIVLKVKGFEKAIRIGSHDLTGAIQRVMRSAGRHDVDLALLLSAQWTNTEARILAQVSAAHGILDAAKYREAKAR